MQNCFYRVNFMGWLLYSGLFVKTPSVGIYVFFKYLLAPCTMTNHHKKNLLLMFHIIFDLFLMSFTTVQDVFLSVYIVKALVTKIPSLHPNMEWWLCLCPLLLICMLKCSTNRIMYYFHRGWCLNVRCSYMGYCLLNISFRLHHYYHPKLSCQY